MLRSLRRTGGLASVLLLALLAAWSPDPSGAGAVPLVATFAGGCFWSMQKAFDSVPGVVELTAGYAGGASADPAYEDVETGTTGHAESVEVKYDPARISYPELLDIYWHHIDPLTPNAAFCDHGPQYRSIIFYHDSAQRRAAEASKRALDDSHRFATPIVTAIEPVTRFYPAEAYHQRFYRTHPAQYEAYRIGCRRDERIRQLWGDATISQESGKAMQARQASATVAQTHAKEWNPMTFKKPDDTELKQKLTPEQYSVTQHEATERPFQNAYWDNHAAGIYVDVVSGEPLFSSLDKFESGTGWPSFTRPLEPANIQTRGDRRLAEDRTEVRSAHADSHLGHVFEDGPPPTGLRYCMNSASLRFVPVERLEAEGYGQYLGLFQGSATR